MMYYVYVIQSKIDFSKYIGYTSDLRKRLLEHNQGKTKSIKQKYHLYYEAYTNSTIARKREIKLKKNSWEKEKLFEKLEDCFMARSSSG